MAYFPIGRLMPSVAIKPAVAAYSGLVPLYAMIYRRDLKIVKK